MALMFFMGKTRAKAIQAEEETKVMVRDVKLIDYSTILTQHLQKQAKNLRNAFVSYNGWKVVLDDNENIEHHLPTTIFSY